MAAGLVGVAADLGSVSPHGYQLTFNGLKNTSDCQTLDMWKNFDLPGITSHSPWNLAGAAATTAPLPPVA
jgi:hypothetical protein